MNCCRAVLPQMIERRSGKIIVVTGGGAKEGRPNFSLYAATKTALVRFVESVAEEVSQHNVQINCMSPSGTYTNMTDEILNAGDRAGAAELEDAQQIQMTGGVPPEKQIELALFLASEKSNHITGRLISVKDDWKKLNPITRVQKNCGPNSVPPLPNRLSGFHQQPYRLSGLIYRALRRRRSIASLPV